MASDIRGFTVALPSGRCRRTDCFFLHFGHHSESHTRRISESVGVPVVASGGAGSLEHRANVLLEGKADAVLAASIFHFGIYTVGDVKQFLAKQNIPARF